MIVVSEMYPNNPGSTFNMDYYLKSHIPMVQQKLGAVLQGIRIEQGIAGGEPGTPPPYHALGHLLFESVGAFQISYGAHAKAIRADVPNYTNSRPMLQISEVKL